MNIFIPMVSISLPTLLVLIALSSCGVAFLMMLLSGFRVRAK